MSSKNHLTKIGSVVEEVLKADFHNVKILRVDVREDVDADGDDVLLISVVFEGRPKDLDAKMLSGAVRNVRPRLTDIGERAFPMFSFVSGRDVGLGHA
ncbi:hypothetical protein [Pelagibacterium sp.]|uniref:hypothetical protein n=1 Tax=Pelagibacterium sp. TaxID=1967288 RepID=UPI003BAD1845